MQNVSRNGSLLLNLTQRSRGNLDTQCTQIAKDIGAWLKVNGGAVYASRPFEVWVDNTVLYTRANGNLYATLFGWNAGEVTLSALKSGGATLGTVSKVELLGSTVAMTFSQSGQGLTVTPGGSVPALTGISDSQLASKMRVLRITHDKVWFNDDDSGAASPGWQRKVALGTGDYNDDPNYPLYPASAPPIGTRLGSTGRGGGAVAQVEGRRLSRERLNTSPFL
jgi:hypothetical protein